MTIEEVSASDGSLLRNSPGHMGEKRGGGGEKAKERKNWGKKGEFGDIFKLRELR